jgi:uncharacterized membrane protein
MTLRDAGHPRRIGTAVLGLYAVVYLAGERLPPAVAGALMIAMALLAGCGLVKPAPPICRRKRGAAPSPCGSATACCFRRWRSRS